MGAKVRKPPYTRKSVDLTVWAPGLTRAIVAAIQNWSLWFRVSRSEREEWREHVRKELQCLCENRCQRSQAHRQELGIPPVRLVSRRPCPLKVPGVDPEGRSKALKK